MKRLLAISLLMAMPLTSALAQTAAIDQSGSYNITVVRQHGEVTLVRTRQVNERRYDQISGRLANHAARISARDVRSSRSRSCGGDGSGNAVRLDQAGGDNLAAVTQAGSNDSASVVQDGNANVSYTIQRGSNETASTTQSGDHNIALIVQRCR